MSQREIKGRIWLGYMDDSASMEYFKLGDDPYRVQPIDFFAIFVTLKNDDHYSSHCMYYLSR